jgi:hypothetical protein
MLERDQAHLLARIQDIMEGVHDGQRQFRIGFQFTGVLDPEGTIGPLPTK